MTSRLSDARSALHGALVTHVSLDPGRIHELPPQQIVAPCVYIGTPEMDPPTSTVAVTFPVVAVYDGAVRAQVAGLDDLTAEIWDAAFAVGVPDGSSPTNLDVAGPSLRAVEVRARVSVAGVTLCAVTLKEAM